MVVPYFLHQSIRLLGSHILGHVVTQLKPYSPTVYSFDPYDLFTKVRRSPRDCRKRGPNMVPCSKSCLTLTYTYLISQQNGQQFITIQTSKPHRPADCIIVLSLTLILQELSNKKSTAPAKSRIKTTAAAAERSSKVFKCSSDTSPPQPSASPMASLR